MGPKIVLQEITNCIQAYANLLHIAYVLVTALNQSLYLTFFISVQLNRKTNILIALFFY